MKKIIMLLVMSISIAATSQNDEAYVDALTQEFTQKLSDRGINNYYAAKRYCLGRIEMFEIGDKFCTSKESYFQVYIVWKEEGKVFIKKIDNCGLFYSLELSNTHLFDFFSTNFETLKNEAVKKYKSATYTGIPELRKNPQPCFRSFLFTENEITFNKSYNLFDISNDSDGANLNYDYNNALKLVLLDAKLEKVLVASEEKMKRQI